MEEKLKSLGWSCHRCSCPGIKGYDCANSKYKGVIITIRGTLFRIIKNSLIVESGQNPSMLEEKMKKHELI